MGAKAAPVTGRPRTCDKCGGKVVVREGSKVHEITCPGRFR